MEKTECCIFANVNKTLRSYNQSVINLRFINKLTIH